MNAVALGRDLARLRRKAGLTQAELAARMGTTQTAVSRTEAGRALPGLVMLDRWTRACGQSFTLVFGRQVDLRSREERRRRVRKALAGFEFNPWDRNPSEAEAESLVADGLTRERFAR